MSTQMRYAGTRGSLDQFFVLWHNIPSYLEEMGTPENIIDFLGSIGFDVRIYRRRPSKKLAVREKHLSGQQFEVLWATHLYIAFDEDAEYTKQFLTTCGPEAQTGWLSTLSDVKKSFRHLKRAGVDPSYAGRLRRAGMNKGSIVRAWQGNLSEEYALALYVA